MSATVGGNGANGRLVVADGLTKDYGDEVKTRALEDVSFAIDPGEFLSIVGQSGSGKSTLLNLIGLLDTPSEGRIALGGRDAGGAGRRARARLRNEYIGFVFQFHHLLPEFSVLENVLMPALIGTGGTAGGEQRRRAEELLGSLGLSGLEDKSANQLSGGQKQRVAIARALMNRPPLVLADEPTGNLDTANGAAVYQLFRSLNAAEGTAFVIVTHDRSIAQQTDRILEVVDGRLVQDVRTTFSPAAQDGGDPRSRESAGAA